MAHISRGEQIRGYVHRENEHHGAHFRGWCTNSRANLCAGARLRGRERISCYTGSYVRTSVWQNPAQWRPSGEGELTELTAVCCWNVRSSLDPAASREVKAASARSLVREDLWRRLRVRHLAWGVPDRRRQREAGAERSWLREVANC